ncbi:MAG: hypothetical protein ABL997_00600 [Planctomycetota bacterium]
MQELLRWIAGLQGIATDGVEMQFEFASFPGGGLGLAVLVLLLLLVLFVGFVYRRDGKHLTGRQRFVLGSLRALAVLAAALLLLEPNLVAVKHDTRPGTAILLVDTSQSMQQLDPFRRDDVSAMADGWRSLGITEPAATSRLDLLKALLRHDDGALVRGLAAKNDVMLYGYSSGLEALSLIAPANVDPNAAPNPDAARDRDGRLPPPKVDVAAITAKGRYSNLGGSLRSALDKSRNSEIAAVVILGDGRRNAGPQAAEIARMLNQRKVPHTFVLGIGDPSATQTVAIGHFEAPEKVFQKDPFEIRATVAQQGYDAMSLTLRLLRTDAAGVSTEVRMQQIELGGDKSEAEVEWKDITSDETGRFVYRVELTPPSGEPPAPERHQKNLPVEVLGERARVLLLAGGANHEFQILRNLLIRDKTIDVSCWLQSADPTFPQDGDEGVRLDALPVDEKQLDPFDVVIAIDPDPSKLTPSFCDLLRKHVLENGCGLWWVAGEKFAIDSFKSTASTKSLVDLLPIVPDLAYAESVANLGLGLAHTRRYPYTLTPEGEDGTASKITRITENRDECRLMWSRLPGFHLAFPVKQLKPAATSLVLHENCDPRLKRDGRGMPLIASHFVGSGRVIFNGVDETYRWRSLFEDAYDRLWVKGIRFLFDGRIHAGNSRLQLRISDEKIELGDALTITVDAKDEQMQALIVPTFDLLLEREGQALEPVKLEPVAELPGSYQLQMRPSQLGVYRLRTMATGGKSVEVPFQVVPAQIESEGPVDRAELQAIAAANGGRLFDTPAQLLAALDEIPSRSATDTYRTPHAMWDGWVTVAVLLSALALEWMLRKRFNLL